MLRMTNCTNIQCTMFKHIDIHLSADKCEIHIKISRVTFVLEPITIRRPRPRSIHGPVRRPVPPSNGPHPHMSFRVDLKDTQYSGKVLR